MHLVRDLKFWILNTKVLHILSVCFTILKRQISFIFVLLWTLLYYVEKTFRDITGILLE